MSSLYKHDGEAIQESNHNIFKHMLHCDVYLSKRLFIDADIFSFKIGTFACHVYFNCQNNNFYQFREFFARSGIFSGLLYSLTVFLNYFVFYKKVYKSPALMWCFLQLMKLPFSSDQILSIACEESFSAPSTRGFRSHWLCIHNSI